MRDYFPEWAVAGQVDWRPRAVAWHAAYQDPQPVHTNNIYI
jgi:hypothetical protein